MENYLDVLEMENYLKYKCIDCIFLWIVQHACNPDQAITFQLQLGTTLAMHVETYDYFTLTLIVDNAKYGSLCHSWILSQHQQEALSIEM